MHLPQSNVLPLYHKDQSSDQSCSHCTRLRSVMSSHHMEWGIISTLMIQLFYALSVSEIDSKLTMIGDVQRHEAVVSGKRLAPKCRQIRSHVSRQGGTTAEYGSHPNCQRCRCRTACVRESQVAQRHPRQSTEVWWSCELGSESLQLSHLGAQAYTASSDNGHRTDTCVQHRLIPAWLLQCSPLRFAGEICCSFAKSTEQSRSCRVATAKTCSGEVAPTITPLASSYSANRVQTDNSDFQSEDHQHTGLSEPASDGVNLHHFHDFTISVQDTVATENHQDMLRRSCFQCVGTRDLKRSPCRF